MKFYRLLLKVYALLLLTITVQSLSAGGLGSNTNYENENQAGSHFLFSAFDSTDQSDSTELIEKEFSPKKRKFKAVVLAVLLGHFGVHRIYLGTSAEVPVFYSLTLGGGLGLLPLMDAVAIIKSEDLSEFANSKKVIMWSSSTEKTTPP